MLKTTRPSIVGEKSEPTKCRLLTSDTRVSMASNPPKQSMHFAAKMKHLECLLNDQASIEIIVGQGISYFTSFQFLQDS